MGTLWTFGDSFSSDFDIHLNEDSNVKKSLTSDISNVRFVKLLVYSVFWQQRIADIRIKI